MYGVLPAWIVSELTGPYGPDYSWKINQIQHWYETYTLGASFLSEDDDSEENFTPAELRSKKVKRLIDQQAEFMMSLPPEIKVSTDAQTDAEKGNENDLQQYINKIFADNFWSGKLLKAAKDCFIGGKVALKAGIKDGKISIIFVPADGFIYETDPDNTDVITRIILFYCVKDSTDPNEQEWWRQRYYVKDGKCYVSESLHDGWGALIDGYKIEDIDTGLSKIPVTVILNDGLTGSLDGESDVQTIEAEDSWRNRMRSQNLDTLRKNMDPLVYIMGADPKTFKGLSRKPGAVNDIAADPVMKGTLPSVGQLENSFNYSNSFTDTESSITTEMYQDLGIPDVSLAATKGLITSGKGLKALYWPLICRCNAKWMAWKPALEWLVRFMVEAAEIYPELKTTYGEFKETEFDVTVDNQYALPEDENEERELDLREVGTSRSIKSYLKKWGGADHKGMTDEQADAEIEQIVLEKRMFEESYSAELLN